MRCFRVDPQDEDPGQLLAPERQWTEPWGGSEHGQRCDKCGGAGETDYECWSCELTGAKSECPVCGGVVRFRDRCPVCKGSGTIDGQPRHGVSVFTTVEALYHYMLDREAELDGCIVVELDGDRAAEPDFDSDQGTLLVIPQQIIGCRPVDRELVENVRKRSAAARASAPEQP